MTIMIIMTMITRESVYCKCVVWIIFRAVPVYDITFLMQVTHTRSVRSQVAIFPQFPCNE
jgi:hypothetical protein